MKVCIIKTTEKLFAPAFLKFKVKQLKTANDDVVINMHV